MSELFQLKPCEECKGTGIVLIEKHDCDCPDCLGTGFGEPAKRIMNLERELTAARAEIAAANDLAETWKTWERETGVKRDTAVKLYLETVKQRDRLAESLTELLDALGATHKPHELIGYGITEHRAQEIVALAAAKGGEA